jgi:hypothetical protein
VGKLPDWIIQITYYHLLATHKTATVTFVGTCVFIKGAGIRSDGQNEFSCYQKYSNLFFGSIGV